MTSLQCSCGRSIPVEPTQSAVVCPQCGRELRLAGPDDLTVAREPTATSDALAGTDEMGSSSKQVVGLEASSELIGPYQPLELLRSLRFGNVYKAYHPVLQRQVLLRTLDPEHAANPQTREEFLSVTKTGTILGTPWYMSPEQAMGKEVDRRSDIYSLGMTLYYLLAGRPAFSGSNPMEVLAQQVADEPRSLEGQVAGITAERWAILRRMLAKKKEDRYGDYDSLLEDLRREQPGAARIAGLGTRLTAELMNWIVQYLLSGAGVTISEIPPNSIGSPFRNVLLAIWIVAFTLVVLAHYCWGVGRLGKTLGKHWMKLRVTRPDGQRVGYLRAALRFLLAYPWFFAFMPIMIMQRLQGASQLQVASWIEVVLVMILCCNLAVLAISALFAWRRPQRRMLHDFLTDTVVVRIPQPEKER